MGPAKEEDNENLLHPNMCGYVKNILNHAQPGDRNMVFTDCCDCAVKLRDVWNCFFDEAMSYLIPLPNREEPAAVAFYKAQLQEFVEFLEEKKGEKLDPEKLKKAIKEYNGLRKAMKRIEELLLQGKILGSQFLTAMLDAQRTDVLEATQELNEFYEKEKDSEGLDYEFKLLQTGSILEDVSLAKLVEEQDANIVYFDTCTASRFYNGLVEEDADPLQAMAERYLNKRIACARMHFSEQRRENLIKLVEDHDIDGVIMRLEKFCSVWSLEYYPMRKLFTKNDIPFVAIESEFDFNVTGQVSTRVEALLEML